MEKFSSCSKSVAVFFSILEDVYSPTELSIISIQCPIQTRFLWGKGHLDTSIFQKFKQKFSHRPFTRTIILSRLMKWLLASNLSQNLKRWPIILVLDPGFYFDKRETKYFHFDKRNHVTFPRGVLCFRNPLGVIESEQSLELLVKSKCLTGKEKSGSVLRLLNLKLENSGCTLYDLRGAGGQYRFSCQNERFFKSSSRVLKQHKPGSTSKLMTKTWTLQLGVTVFCNVASWIYISPK